jgi:hypothetical protein
VRKKRDERVFVGSKETRGTNREGGGEGGDVDSIEGEVARGYRGEDTRERERMDRERLARAATVGTDGPD